QHARRAIGDLARGRLLLQPLHDGVDIVGLDRAAVLVAQQVLDQHLQRDGQLREPREPIALGVGQREVLVGFAADLEGLAAFERIRRCGSGAHSSISLRSIGQTACGTHALQAVGRGRVRPHLDWPRGGPRSYKSGSNMQRRAGEALMKLIADDLASIRGGRTLFSGLSFTVGEGEALLLTGPNGAGKTTLIRTIAGLLGPAAGSVRLEGGGADRSVGEQCHYVGHLNAIKSALTVEENAAFWCRFLGGEAERIATALAAFGLDALRDIPAAYLSAGQKRRLGLARVLVAERPIWLLDEPTVSLDEAAQAVLARAVDAHTGHGGLVVAATHMPLAFAGARELRLGRAAAAA